MRSQLTIRSVLRAISHFTIFFLTIGFVISCCMMLFIQIMAHTMGLDLTSEDIQTAAKYTFANVLLLSLLCTVFDSVRRRITITRPVKIITDATKKIMQGDFSVRIPPVAKMNDEDPFNQIADCINKMTEELSGTETLRTDFVANVSHELKTPLSVMQNYGTMLQAPDLPDEKRIEYAKAVTAASRRLADLVTNILRLNKLENQQIVLSPVSYDLSEQLCECLLSFEEVWEKKGLEIETEIEDGITVRSDPEMMSLVWNNLFSNAIKFTDAGGKVGLSVCSEGKFAVVRISDTGCGISAEVGARMFDKFYQGDTSHSTQGNGLGLALVKRVIDLAEADISVESELGKGTVFTVKMQRM